MDFRNVNPSTGNVAKSNSKSTEFFFLKIVKIEACKQGSNFFFKMKCLQCLFFISFQTSLFISFTLVIGMTWTKASLVGMDLSNMV